MALDRHRRDSENNHTVEKSSIRCIERKSGTMQHGLLLTVEHINLLCCVLQLT